MHVDGYDLNLDFNQLNMELTVQNSRVILQLPIPVLNPYLPRIFDKFRNPQTDGHWIDAYLVSHVSGHDR